MAGIDYGFYNDNSHSGLAATDPNDTAIGATAPYLAVGAFSSSAATFTSLGSVSDFDAYAQSLLAKTTEISADNSHFTLTGATMEFVAIGGDGDDTLSADGSDSGLGTMIGGNGADVINGGSGQDTLDGGDGNDTIVAGNGANHITGGSGLDVIHAGSGGNQIDGGDGADTITSGAGADSITGGLDADSISGGGGADTIDGGAGQDRENGEGGNDTLISDGADDRLIGGSGHDTYQFTAFTSANVGAVSALGAGDLVDLTGAAASLGFSTFEAVYQFDSQPGEVRAAYSAAHDRTVYYFDIDGDGVADHKLVVRGAHSDGFTYFAGVDTSHLQLIVTPDHGGFVA
jgi:Ca2+-binding RTX toxin-like protein